MAEEQLAREDQSISADDLAALKQRAETAESAAQQLQQQRDEAANRVYTEISRRVQADETAIVNAIAAATAEGDAAERKLAEALASNDVTMIARAQRELTRADMHLDQAETQNRNLQNWKQQQIQKAQAEEQQRQQQPQRPHVPQGQIDLSGYSSATQDWLRQHPDLIKNTPEAEVARNLVVSDHYVAQARGLRADTPSYFEFLEGGYQGRKADGGQGSPYSQAADTVEVDLQRAPEDSGVRITRNEPAPRPAETRASEAQRQSSRALPPSRSNSPATGSHGNGRVTLTLGEQDAARSSWPHLPPEQAYREYAINKVELQKEGRL